MKQLLMVLNSIFILYLLFLIYKRFEKVHHKYVILLLVITKIACAIAIGWLYFYYYGSGDTYGYHWDSVILTEIAKKDFNLYFRLMIDHESVKLANNFANEYLFFYWQHKAFTIAKIVSVLNFVTVKNYWLNAIYFTLFSIFSGLYIAEKFNKIYPNNKLIIYSSFLFFPSILFWTSGLMKETLVVSMLFVFIGNIIELYLNDKIKLKNLFYLFVSAIIILYFKYYIAAIFFPFIFFFLIIEKTRFIQKTVLKVVSLLGLTLSSFIVLNFVAHYIDPHLDLAKLPQVFYDSYLYVIYFSEKYSETLNYNVFSGFEPSYKSLFVNAPEIIFKGLFYPTVLQECNFLQRIYSLENTFKLIMVVLAFFGFFMHKTIKNDLFFWTMLFVILLASLVISASCPNWGSISRLKSFYVPFLSFYSLLLASHFIKEMFLKKMYANYK
jgi:hypothetical protein